jgi:hypothetical protein
MALARFGEEHIRGRFPLFNPGKDFLLMGEDRECYGSCVHVSEQLAVVVPGGTKKQELWDGILFIEDRTEHSIQTLAPII